MKGGRRSRKKGRKKERKKPREEGNEIKHGKTKNKQEKRSITHRDSLITHYVLSLHGVYEDDPGGGGRLDVSCTACVYASSNIIVIVKNKTKNRLFILSHTSSSNIFGTGPFRCLRCFSSYPKKERTLPFVLKQRHMNLPFGLDVGRTCVPSHIFSHHLKETAETQNAERRQQCRNENSGRLGGISSGKPLQPLKKKKEP